MFILAQNGAAAVDAMGLEIRALDQRLDDGSVQTVAFQIFGFGFGFQVLLGEYPMEQQARDVFNDILVSMRRNESFYDVRSEERKFIDRKG